MGKIMRKYNIKRDLSYHEGAYSAITEIMYHIDKLITESCHYRENDKLWRLRDRVLTLYNLSRRNINELKEELNNERN